MTWGAENDSPIRRPRISKEKGVCSNRKRGNFEYEGSIFTT
jgi:hypothetical protein